MAVEATLAGFRAHFGDEFPAATYPDAAVSRAVDDAGSVYNRTARGQLYLAAHYLLLDAEARRDAGASPAAAVTAEQVGPRRVSYTSLAADADDSGFATTIYGLRFLELRRRAGAGPWSFP